MSKQRITPINVGNITERAVVFKLLVSLYIVIQVVEQGKWNIHNIIKHTAVVKFQPLLTRNIPSCSKPL